ncbi:hypothetical protein Scep_019537 [Stephania cephalantha]|uniref:Adenylyl-sulfate kinase n=1 Tax=Stephania cephalantha TaxID=152367 RepID=A0AAP0IB09_9MAGN
MTAFFRSIWFPTLYSNVEFTNSSRKLGFFYSGDFNSVQFTRKSASLVQVVAPSIAKSKLVSSLKAIERSTRIVCMEKKVGGFEDLKSEAKEAKTESSCVSGNDHLVMCSIGQSTNVVWHESPIGKLDRQNLLQQKGCVVWITGLSGSGKSTVACALNKALYHRGKLAYILDGDNLRHGLNCDLGFTAEDRAENIRRVGEVAKLFADAGVICIASLVSPYRRDRDACRTLFSDKNFIEVFMDVPLHVCEARDPKGLYKLARAGKIKGFTGVDDPYEPPLNCEMTINASDGNCPSPCDMAEQVISYMDEKGFLQA